MTRKLSDAAPRSAFADGAARFAEIARNVKTQQLSEQQGVVPPAPRFDPPDEIWARQYSTQAIGPSGAQALTAMAPVPHHHDVIPDLAMLKPGAARSREFSTALEIARPSASEVGTPIGFGPDRKRPVRRSWLGRLLRGS